MYHNLITPTMKKTFLFIVTLLFAVATVSRAQPPVVDKYPDAEIYIIDPQTGQVGVKVAF